MKTTVCLFAGLLLLAGCATDPFSAAHKAGIHTIQLDPAIESGDGIRYGVEIPKSNNPFTDSDKTSDIMNEVGWGGIRRMQVVMKRHQIFVPQMIHDRLEQQLRDQAGLTLVDQPPADGILTIRIVQYGFADMPYSMMHEVPFVMLRLEIHDKDGHLVWTRKNKWHLPSNDDAGASWEQYETDPAQLRDEWNTAINEVANKLIPIPSQP